MKGWYGLSWLTDQLYSPYIVVLIVIFSFFTPFIVSKQMATKTMIPSAIILYTVNMLCFELGKHLCYALYCRFCLWKTKDIVLIFLIAFILFVLLGITYWLVTNKLIKKNKKINILLITLFAMFSIPLSLLTIKINTGFGTQSDWVDVVKMGYPIFWIIMALGFSAIIIARQRKIIQTQQK